MKRPSFEKACGTYVHRFTMDHVPAWAKEIRVGGDYYAPQFRSDREWYENTLFPGEPGHFGDRHSCYTNNQTWPVGKSLQKPFTRS